MGLLTRSTQTATLEPFDGRTGGGQGTPSYGAGVEVEGRLVESPSYSVGPDGAELSGDAMWYQDASETPLPSGRDRLTVDGTAYIVQEPSSPKNGHGSVHHVTCELLEE